MNPDAEAELEEAIAYWVPGFKRPKKDIEETSLPKFIYPLVPCRSRRRHGIIQVVKEA